MEKKKNQNETINTGKAVRAYKLLTAATTDQKEGFKLSAELETQDIFRVLRIANALKPIATAFIDFQKDAQEKLKPENWDKEVVPKLQKFSELTEEEKIAVNSAIIDYNGKVSECVSTEVEKDKPIDSYEHVSEDSFAKLVKANQHLLDLNDVVLLQEILG